MAFLHMEIISKLICKNSTVFNGVLHSMSYYLNSYMRILLFKSCTSLTQISTICHFYLPHNTLNLIRSYVFTTLFYGTEGCLKTGITSYLLPCLKYTAGIVHPISTYLVSSYRMSLYQMMDAKVIQTVPVFMELFTERINITNNYTERLRV